MNEKAYQRLTEIHSELYDIANTFAGTSASGIAFELHQSANRILTAQNMMKTGVTNEDSDRQSEEWCNQQIFPISKEERQLVKELFRNSS